MLFGVMGHVDHGKTALVRALTGMETDRLPEEKLRGVSIALGFAHAAVGGAELDFIDMPGHERFVRTMVSGATGVQAMLLVVAANELIKPQTVEHAEVAALLGVRRTVIAVTKADLVTADDAEAAARTAAAFAAQAGLESGPPVLTSAHTGQGLDALKHALAVAAQDAPAPRDDGFSYLPVDRAFVAPGHGVVVTGTLHRGRLAKGEVVEALPGAKSLRVRGLQVHGQAVEAALPGQRVAVNLRGAELDAAPRGTALVQPGRVIASDWLTVELTAAPSAPELAGGARLNLLIGTSETAVRLRLLDRDTLKPGESALAQLHAAAPVAAPARERFILRVPSPAATVAGGQVLDPEARRLRRRDARQLAYLARLAAADGPAALAAAVEQAGAQGIAFDRASRLAGLSPERAAEALKRLPAVRTRTDVLATQSSVEGVSTRLVQALRKAEHGLPPPRLRGLVPDAGLEVVEHVVSGLAAAGKARVEGGAVRLVHAAQDRAKAESEAQVAARLAEALRKGGLSPPDLVAEGEPREVRRALERLARENLVVRTYDRVQKREIIFHREAVEAARRMLAPHLASEGLLVKEAGAILGISRKFSVPLLEHLDAVQFTRRVGDRRVLGPSAAS